MENGYVEKMVTKAADLKIYLIRTAVILAAVLVTYLGFVLFGVLGAAVYGLIILFLMAWLVYYVFSVTYVEYEFVLVKNELTIDAIYGKNKRKNLHTIDVSKCEVIAPYDSTYAAGYHRNEKMTAFDYTAGTGEPVYLLAFGYGASNAKLYMEFDEKMLNGMKMAAPGKVK